MNNPILFQEDERIVDLGFKYIEPFAIFSFNTCLFLLAGAVYKAKDGHFFLECQMLFVFFLICVFSTQFSYLASKQESLEHFQQPSYQNSSQESQFWFYFTATNLVSSHSELNQLLKKFSPNTWPALKVGTSSLIAQLSICIPSIMVRKFIGMACSNEPQVFAD